MLQDDHLVQAMEAAGVCGRNVVYVSVPITSGLRELRLLDELGLRSSASLRAEQPERWRQDVVQKNSTQARATASRVRQAPWIERDSVVVDPSRISIQGWEQDDYNRFWVRLMKEHVRFLVPSDGWEYSRGARTEVGYALSLGPDVVQVRREDGTAARPDQLRGQAEAARRSLEQRGWDRREVDDYLPPLPESEPDLSASAQSQAFDWLIAERRFQVRHYGSQQDDQHLEADGLRPDGWWSTQLERYLDAARTSPLAETTSRLELAKFAATAIAALESAIRVHGAVPRPTAEERQA